MANLGHPFTNSFLIIAYMHSSLTLDGK